MTSQHKTGTHPFWWQASRRPILIHFYDQLAKDRRSSILHRYVYTHIHTYICTYIFPEGMFTYFSVTSLDPRSTPESDTVGALLPCAPSWLPGFPDCWASLTSIRFTPKTGSSLRLSEGLLPLTPSSPGAKDNGGPMGPKALSKSPPDTFKGPVCYRLHTLLPRSIIQQPLHHFVSTASSLGFTTSCSCRQLFHVAVSRFWAHNPRLSKASCSARPLFHVSHLSQNLASRIFVVHVSATIGAITKLQTFKMDHCRLHRDHVWSKPQNQFAYRHLRISYRIRQIQTIISVRTFSGRHGYAFGWILLRLMTIPCGGCSQAALLG